MRKYRLVLVNLNSLPGLDVEPIFPIGPVYVTSFLRQVGVQVEMIDFHQTPDQLPKLDFLKKPVDCVAFSIRYIDTLELDAVFQLKYYRNVMKRIITKAKQVNPSVQVLVGGGGYAVYAAGLKEVLPFDHGVKGNVEENLYQLIEEHIKRIPENIELIEDFSMFNMGFEQGLVQTYLEMGAGQIGLPTRCGGRCPLKCAYCSYSKIDSKTNLLRPLANLRNDILRLYRFGVREIFFTDSLFNISTARAKSICRMLIELQLDDLKWFAYARPTTDQEFIELAAQSGCQSLMVSFDTFSPDMLKRLRKSFNLQQAETFIGHCRQYGVSLIGLLLFGGPDEDERTIKETCDFINQHFREGEFFYSFGMRLLPGSKLTEMTGIPERELLVPTFWPFAEACFDHVLTHLDNRFLSFYRLARISNWRKGFHQLRPHYVQPTGVTVLKRPISAEVRG